MIWLLAFLWAYVPFMFLEQAAEHEFVHTAKPAIRWKWPFNGWFVILVFLLWPIVVPAATYLRRHTIAKGLSSK